MTARVLATITPEHTDRYHLTLVRWIEANGIDPKVVPIDQPITIEQVGDRTVICYREIQLSSEGRHLIDPDNDCQVLTVRRSRDERVPLAAIAIEQLLADVATAAYAHAHQLHLVIEPAPEGQATGGTVGVRVWVDPAVSYGCVLPGRQGGRDVGLLASAFETEGTVHWVSATECDQTPGG
ncbi:hypothetical protein [Streptomyces sp. CB03911]|uniref:hypothetical protein n=1 Tax=Streptomyces sp. CB03911 TaxID=1804758 RepID=UPI00093BEEF0|nr:hypothetical protein [Streptomyces sp. CB03911]OKI22216.1 hypothetical protein A6A07_34645 [Streptomyces sp. CB03911]